MTKNPDKNNDTSVVVNEDKLKIISTQIEKEVNDIEQKLYLINSLFSDIEYCWSDSASDLLRENYHYDKETAENIIYNLKQRKVKEQIRIEQAKRTDNLVKGLIRDYGHNF